MADKEAFCAAISQLNDHLKNIEEHVDKMNTEMTPEQLAEISLEDNAHLNSSLAYSLHAMLWSIATYSRLKSL